MNNHGFTLAVGLREISIDPRDRLEPTYVSSKSNRKRNSELIDLLEEVLFRLVRSLAWIDRLLNLWSEKFWCNLSIAIDEKMFEGMLSWHSINT